MDKGKKTGGRQLITGIVCRVKVFFKRYDRRYRKLFRIIGGAAVLFALFFSLLPTPFTDTSYSPVLVDTRGILLGASIAGDEQWRFPPLDSIPEKFITAATHFEDRRFFYHPGIDPIALVRACVQNIRQRRVISGASTITMQVIRLSRPDKKRTIGEKLFEMTCAVKLELLKSKREIFRLYASHAPFGGNVVGIEAASWRYFGRTPHNLSWAETAMLAVLPNSPALIHPGKNRMMLKKKRDMLLNLLRHRGIIDSLTCSISQAEPLPPKPYPIPVHAPHLLERLKDEKSTNTLLYGRLQVTIDRTLQIQANNLVLRHYKKLQGNEVYNCAALIVDNRMNAIIGYVGNVFQKGLHDHGNYVDIVTAPRSTGSILKPILYACMLHDGELLPIQLIPDIPIRMGSFSPQNYSRSYEGAVPASMALARSLNIPAVYMLHVYGVDRFYDKLKSLHFSTLTRSADDYGLTLILGGAEGTLWDIVSLYSSMANRVTGFFNPEIKLRPLQLLKNTSEIPIDTLNYDLDAASCWLTLQAMLEVVRPDEEMAWKQYTSSGKIAWKTGTSYGFRDAWAVGVCPAYTVGVWAGNADGEGRAGMTGFTAAAPLLFELFDLLNTGAWFEKPEAAMKKIAVCKKSGYRKGMYCRESKLIDVPEHVPTTPCCPFCKSIVCDRYKRWRLHADCASIAEMEQTSWFILPPAQEWFYIQKHADYRKVPPYRPDCVKTLDANTSQNMSLICPKANSDIYIPLELDGKRGRVVLKAVHRDSKRTIFWHVDNTFIGSTRRIHQISIVQSSGRHTVTLVDDAGEMVQRHFTILEK